MWGAGLDVEVETSQAWMPREPIRTLRTAEVWIFVPLCVWSAWFWFHTSHLWQVNFFVGFLKTDPANTWLTFVYTNGVVFPVSTPTRGLLSGFYSLLKLPRCMNGSQMGQFCSFLQRRAQSQENQPKPYKGTQGSIHQRTQYWNPGVWRTFILGCLSIDWIERSTLQLTFFFLFEVMNWIKPRPPPPQQQPYRANS